MIQENDVERAVDFLRDSAPKLAEARANRIYNDEMRKSLKALLMAEHAEDPLGAQERMAYSDKRYLEHLHHIKSAVFQEELIRAQREAAIMKIEAWRTQSATLRGIKI